MNGGKLKSYLINLIKYQAIFKGKESRIDLPEKNYHQAYKIFCYSQKQPPKVFYINGILKNFAKFLEKYMCQSLFFNKVAGQKPAT